jgi:AcrR family transcriptional regulator
MLTASPERAPPARHRRRGFAATRQQILAASLHLFARNGFSGTTVRDIARRAGISDAAIYYHFASKEELFREVLNTRLPVKDWAAAHDACTTLRGLLQDVVRDAVVGITRAIGENHELLRLILREGLAGDQAAACRYGQLLDGWESHLAGHLITFESAGMLGSGEARPVARQIISAIIMAHEDRLVLRPNRSLPPAERRLETLASLFRNIDGLLPPAFPNRAGRRGLQVSHPA